MTRPRAAERPRGRAKGGKPMMEACRLTCLISAECVLMCEALFGFNLGFGMVWMCFLISDDFSSPFATFERLVLSTCLH